MALPPFAATAPALDRSTRTVNSAPMNRGCSASHSVRRSVLADASEPDIRVDSLAGDMLIFLKDTYIIKVKTGSEVVDVNRASAGFRVIRASNPRNIKVGELTRGCVWPAAGRTHLGYGPLLPSLAAAAPTFDSSTSVTNRALAIRGRSASHSVTSLAVPTCTPTDWPDVH